MVTVGVRDVIQPVSQPGVLLQLVTRELEDGVEREKVILVMFLSHSWCSAMLKGLNRKGQVTLDVPCPALQVLMK